MHSPEVFVSDPDSTPAPAPARDAADLCPQQPPRERRRVPRESTGAPPHVAEKPRNPEPIAPIAPHMAEAEPVKEAEFVTVRSPRGKKTTIVVERTPGKATHATVVDENPQVPEVTPPPVPAPLPPAAPQGEARTEKKRRRRRRVERR